MKKFNIVDTKNNIGKTTLFSTVIQHGLHCLAIFFYSFYATSCYFNCSGSQKCSNKFISVIASDVPGGNPIYVINIKAQQSAFNKAIRTRFK